MADFFDKVKGGISKGVATVSANSKAMLETAKIKSAISNLENEVNEIYRKMGSEVYKMHKDTGSISFSSEIQEYCTEAAKRYEMIEQQNELLRKVDEELSLVTGSGKSAAGAACSCGAANKEGAKFCVTCGARIA